MRNARDPYVFEVPRRPMQRVLAFAGRSIDDVVNSPLAKREVLHYFRLGRSIARQCEVVDLERQWDGRGTSVPRVRGRTHRADPGH